MKLLTDRDVVWIWTLTGRDTFERLHLVGHARGQYSQCYSLLSAVADDLAIVSRRNAMGQ